MGLNYNPASVTQGLVYYLDFTNTRCYSGSGNTLINLANGAIGITIVSGITYDTDNRKNLNFNGSSGYMTGNDTNLDFSTSDFTIQTTLKLNGLSNGFTGAYGSAVCAGSALTNNSSILQFSGTASSHYGVALWHQPTSSNIGRNYNFQTNKIYNLAVTKRYNVVEFFVDGTSIGTTTTSNNFNFTANGFAIGRWYYPGYEQYLKGNIYDFRAYNRALSIDEIQQNYFAQTKRYYNEENIVTNGLVLNIDPSKSTSYSGVGNTIYDLSGFGNTGTLTNGPTFSALNGGNIVFDGTNDTILLNRNDIISGTQNFTIDAYIYPVITTAEHIFGNYNGGNTNGLELYLYQGKVTLYYGGTFTFSNPVILANNWYHVCAVRNNNTTYIYVNGMLDTTGTNSTSVTTTRVYSIGNGYDYNGEAFYGNISQVKVYNRALSQQEISQNFNALRSRFGI